MSVPRHILSPSSPDPRANSWCCARHRIARENALLDDVGDVAQGRVGRALDQRRPFRICHHALEAVELPVDDEAPAFV